MVLGCCVYFSAARRPPPARQPKLRPHLLLHSAAWREFLGLVAQEPEPAAGAAAGAAAVAASSELDSLDSQDYATLVEALCRAGLVSAPAGDGGGGGGGGGGEEVAAAAAAAAAAGGYFEAISARFAAPILAAAAAAPHDAVPAPRLLVACVGLRGVAAAVRRQSLRALLRFH
eukprot:SAG22_NODE_181_length_16048_cov_157.464418_20_plen_173_part_00